MSDQKWTTSSIPDQSGRVAVITGANAGLGLETAIALARAGACVVLAVRDTGKGDQAAERIRIRVPSAELSVRELDLASLASVRESASSIAANTDRIDLLVNNAGVMVPPKGVTADGFELQFGTNHLGHFALTGLLLERLLATPGSRVVTVSSVAHRYGADIHFDDLQWERSYNRHLAYAQSKLANLLFAYALQRRLETASATTVSLAAHPGGARTGLQRHAPAPLRPLFGMILQSAAMGALPTLRAATDPDVAGGQYFGPSGFQQVRGDPVRVDSTAKSHDEALQDRLWTVSEELTGVTYPI